MNSTWTQKPSGDTGTAGNWLWALMALLLFAPVILIPAGARTVIVVAYFGVLSLLALLAFPRVLFYLFLISIGFHYAYFVGATTAVLPSDILAALLVVICFLEYLLHDSTSIRFSFIDTAFWALIGGTIVSALFAHDPGLSVIPVVRIVTVYAAFRLVQGFALEMGVRKVILFYLYVVIALSLVNLAIFVLQGGRERVFGPAWLGYETLSMTALPMAVGFLVWAETIPRRAWYALVSIVIGLGMLASGSRGPMLAVVITVPMLMVFGWRKARREQSMSSLRVIRGILIPLAALVAAVVVLQETLFTGVVERLLSLIESIKNPQETVLLRLVLAKAAIQAFLSDPLTGIGIGNFRVVDEIVPQMRMAPVWFYIRGMSAHNVVLHYLAETGLLGTLPLVVLAGAGLRNAYRLFRTQLTNGQHQVSASLFVGMMVFCLTLLYMRAWTWGQGGYIMALLFGLATAWREEVSIDTGVGN